MATQARPAVTHPAFKRVRASQNRGTLNLATPAIPATSGKQQRNGQSETVAHIARHTGMGLDGKIAGDQSHVQKGCHKGGTHHTDSRMCRGYHNSSAAGPANGKLAMHQKLIEHAERNMLMLDVPFEQDFAGMGNPWQREFDIEAKDGISAAPIAGPSNYTMTVSDELFQTWLAEMSNGNASAF